MPRHQPPLRVAVVLGGLLAVAAVLTAATYRASSDRGSRAQVNAQPVQAATAPPVQTPPMQTPSAGAAPAPAATAGTPSRQAAAGSVDAPVTVGSAGQRTAIDPVTKQLRELEHDEAAALSAMARAQRRARRSADVQTEPEPIYGPAGAIGMVVPEELQTFMVATRTPDGRIVLEHATGPKAAQTKTRAGASKPRTIDGKEEPNVR
jgi:hypothetical protein